MAYGLTETGFNIKPSDVIKQEFQTVFKESFGNDIDISEQSNFGVLIGLLTRRETVLWEQMNAVYNTRDPNNAEGISLDKVVQFVGIKRLEAIKSQVLTVLFGEDGTLIEAEQLVAKEGSLEEFELNSSVTINKNNAYLVRLEITDVQDSTDYTISINGTDYTYTSDATATAGEIIQGLRNLVNAGDEDVTMTSEDDGTGEIISDSTSETFIYANSTSNVDLTEVGTPGTYLAINAGEIIVAVGQLTEIITPVTGLNSVYNYEAGVTGREIETDVELKQRRKQALIRATGGTEIAILNGLLEEVSNVSDANITSNRTNSTDSEGRPAKSFECVVVGGTDEDVAKKILEKAPAGIETFGNTTISVTDSQGFNVDIEFSRPETKYLWIQIEYSLDEETSFPTNGENLIKEAILEFADSEYVIGKDVLRQKIFTPIFSVPGVGDVSLLQIALTDTEGGSPSYVSTNLDIGFREIANLASDRISLTEV